MPDSIIPISDAQAKAIEEALKTLQGFGGFLQENVWWQVPTRRCYRRVGAL